MDIAEGSQMEISLTEVACHLGVEKRRVYDIINVVESLKMAIKVIWHINIFKTTLFKYYCLWVIYIINLFDSNVFEYLIFVIYLRNIVEERQTRVCILP